VWPPLACFSLERRLVADLDLIEYGEGFTRSGPIAFSPSLMRLFLSGGSLAALCQESSRWRGSLLPVIARPRHGCAASEVACQTFRYTG
jgi:hypothetical protein